MIFSTLPPDLMERIKSSTPEELMPELTSYLELHDPCYQKILELERQAKEVKRTYGIYLAEGDELTGRIQTGAQGGTICNHAWLTEDAQAEYITALAEFTKTAHSIPELSIRYISLNQDLPEIKKFEALADMIPPLKKLYEKRGLYRILEKEKEKNL